MRTRPFRGMVMFGCLTLMAALGSALAAEEGKGEKIEFGDYSMQAPKDWTKKQPKVNIIAYEFAAPAAEGDKIDGRMTIMAAGGSVEANLERWYGQFAQPDGSATADKAKVEEKKIADQTVHMVDISGTFKDQAGPFAPAVVREGYRMLAAIIETKQGNLFVKFYGPEKTIKQHEEAFKGMIGSLK